MSRQSVCAIQNRALSATDDFMKRAAKADDHKEASGWSLAAKNAAAVATNCETILKIKNGGR